MLNPPECPTFTLIQNGVKKVEGRKYSPKYQQYNVGDTLVFTFNGDSVSATITFLHKYKTLEDYLRGETVEAVLPGVTSFDAAVRLYNTWSSPQERELFTKAVRLWFSSNRAMSSSGINSQYYCTIVSFYEIFN